MHQNQQFKTSTKENILKQRKTMTLWTETQKFKMSKFLIGNNVKQKITEKCL